MGILPDSHSMCQLPANETREPSRIGAKRRSEKPTRAHENRRFEKKALELSDDEKLLMSILKNNSPIDLNELKGQTGLSNKKWDKAIKGLTKNKLAKVEKTDEGLLVSVV